MNAQLQEWLDRLSLTSPQRWVLIVVAVASAGAASAVSGAAAGEPNIAVGVLISLLAAGACLRADTHIALMVVGGVAWQWLDGTDHTATPWALAAGGALFVFHAAVALMAVTPITATVARAVVVTWCRRGVLVMVAAAGTWLLVAVFSGRDRPGDAALTSLGFVLVVVLALLARARSAPPRVGPHD